jgi:hypothetical protein
MQTSIPEGNDVPASPLRKLLIISGFAIGILSLAMNALPMLAWGYLPRLSRADILYPFLILLFEAAPVVLLIGMAAFQQRKRWARVVLFTYAGMWLLARIGLCIFNCVTVQNSISANPRVHRTVIQRIAVGAGLFQPLVYETAYPIFLVILLCMPELKDTFSSPTRGFSPVLASVEPVPAEPVPAE